jgi:hypothetical protein
MAEAVLLANGLTRATMPFASALVSASQRYSALDGLGRFGPVWRFRHNVRTRREPPQI